jgi:hypothetical protein
MQQPVECVQGACCSVSGDEDALPKKLSSPAVPDVPGLQTGHACFSVVEKVQPLDPDIR